MGNLIDFQPWMNALEELSSKLKKLFFDKPRKWYEQILPGIGYMILWIICAAFVTAFFVLILMLKSIFRSKETILASICAIALYNLVIRAMNISFTYEISTELPRLIIGPDMTRPLKIWDITDYAESKNHEKIIHDFLDEMGPIGTAEDAQLYINKYTKDKRVSPMTGQMVMNSCATYELDPRLLLALMRNDSRFGTDGKGMRMHNPGNVFTFGKYNTDMKTWQWGVDAVAWWLDNHRFDKKRQSSDIPPPVEAFLRRNNMKVTGLPRPVFFFPQSDIISKWKNSKKKPRSLATKEGWK